MTVVTLKGGAIVDGTGAPATVGNVIMRDDRIVAVGTDAVEGKAIDVDGLVVAPGFVDLHSHAEWLTLLPEGPELLAANVLQGITSAVGGNCGISPAPLGERVTRAALERATIIDVVSHKISWEWRSLAELFAHMERRGLALNVAMLVGHGTLRASVVGAAVRSARDSEVAQMQGLLREALADGAVGLSLGLEYIPGCYAPTDELDALASLLTSSDALLAAHTRGISALYDDAMREALGVAERAGCRVQLSHVNPMGPANWGGSARLMERLDALADRRIGFDIVTHTTWRVGIMEVLPRTVAQLGNTAIFEAAAQPDGREALRAAIEAGRPTWPSWYEGGVTRNPILELGWDAMLIVDPACASLEHVRGQTIGAVAADGGRDPYDVFFDLAVGSRGRTQLLNDGYGGSIRDESPLEALVVRPDALPGSDTVPLRGDSGQVHVRQPMFWGTMPRFIGRWCRDLAIVPLEDAVRRMTSAPAAVAGLEDRGVLRDGAWADVVVFDPERIGERGTYDPLPPAGIPHVFINGAHVVADGDYDSTRRAGRALRRAE